VAVCFTIRPSVVDGTGLLRLRVLLKRYFVTGLLVTLPIAGTYFILSALLKALEGVLGELLRTHLEAHYYPGLGITVLIVGIFTIGLLTANFMGRWFVRLYERILKRLPLVRSVYSAIKNVVQTVSMQGQDSFQGVVLVEFPRRDMYLLAFVVNRTKGEIADQVDKPLLNLFVPTSPNPTSGYLVFVPTEDVKHLSISVEEAMQTIMSGGIYTAGIDDDDVLPTNFSGEERRDEGNDRRSADPSPDAEVPTPDRRSGGDRRDEDQPTSEDDPQAPTAKGDPS